MPVFVDDPSQLSKARLKSDLIAHNVALPPAKSKKEVYVELHTRHVDQKNGADFSSDEEQDQGEDEEEPKDAQALDPSHLTDADLKAALLQHGVKAGPIVASTRAVYEMKLQNLLLSNGHSKSNGKENGADEAVLYSDSEKEEDSGEELEEPDAEDPLAEAEPADQSQPDSKQIEDHGYPQCFYMSSRLRPARNRQPSPKQNLRNVLRSSQQTRSRSTQIPSVISEASSIDQPSGLAKGLSSAQQSVISIGSVVLPQNFSITEMVEQIESRKSCSPHADAAPEFKERIVQDHWSRSNRETDQDLVADMYVPTRRRPIKGAAGRPVQFGHRYTPVSPTSLQRVEVEKRMAPMIMRILVFLIAIIVLYVIYVCVEDD